MSDWGLLTYRQVGTLSAKGNLELQAASGQHTCTARVLALPAAGTSFRTLNPAPSSTAVCCCSPHTAPSPAPAAAAAAAAAAPAVPQAAAAAGPAAPSPAAPAPESSAVESWRHGTWGASAWVHQGPVWAPQETLNPDQSPSQQLQMQLRTLNPDLQHNPQQCSGHRCR